MKGQDERLNTHTNCAPFQPPLKDNNFIGRITDFATRFWKLETGRSNPDLEVPGRQNTRLLDSLEGTQICSHPRAIKALGACSPRRGDVVVAFLVAQSCLTLCNPMDCSLPGFPVIHHLSELAQTHIHSVNDAIQPSHPLSSSSPPALDLSQNQGLLQ